jgi:hypothetical protein
VPVYSGPAKGRTRVPGENSKYRRDHSAAIDVGST